jgi:hypothetical protein
MPSSPPDALALVPNSCNLPPYTLYPSPYTFPIFFFSLCNYPPRGILLETLLMKREFQLQIPEPCHENWNAMSPADKGRFCASCQKVVIDFSRMTDNELAAFFKKPSGSVCGHLRQDQLNRDLVIPRKRIPWIKYFFQFILPAFLFSARATAQGRVVGRIKSKTPVRTETRIHDSVLTTSSLGDKARQQADEAKKTLQQPMQEIDACTREQMESGLTTTRGAVFVGIVVDRRPDKPTTFIQKLFDTRSKSLNVYPNPALPSSTLTIEWKEKEEGQLQVQLTNAAGQAVYSSEVSKEYKQNRFTITVPQIPQGIYFLSVRNLKTGKQAASEIVIGQPEN